MRFARSSAIALGAVLLFSVLSFAATEQWALSMVQCAIFALGIGWALRAAILFRPIRLHALAIAPGAVVLSGLLQLALHGTEYRFATSRTVLDWAAYLVLFLVSLQVFSHAPLRTAFLRTTLLGGFAVCVLSTLQHFTSGGRIYWIFPTRSGRPFGPFVNPDHYAVFAEILLAMAIYEAVQDRERMWLHLVMTGVLYASIVAAGSRCGVILGTLEILILPLLGAAKNKRPTIFMPVAFAVLATAIVGWDGVRLRFQEANPFRYRREMAISTLQMIRQRPWTGFGLGTFEAVYPAYASFDLGSVVDHAHNDWLEWTAEGGIPVLLVLLSLAALSFRLALRNPWALGIHVAFLHSFVDFPLHIPAIAVLVFLLLAALSAER